MVDLMRPAGAVAANGLLVRPYVSADATAVTDLLNLIDRHNGGEGAWLASRFDEFVRIRVADPASDSRLLLAASGVLVAYGVVTTPTGGDGAYIDLVGGVHPDWRGRRIGRDLLDWQLARAARLRATVAPRASDHGYAGAVEADLDTVRLLRRRGFAPVRSWQRMAAELSPTAQTAESAPRLPAGMRVVGFSAEHERALHATHMAVFADHWGHQPTPFERWVTRVRSAPFLAEQSVLAFCGDDLIGHVLCAGTAEPDLVVVRAVGVLRAWRGRGVATALLARALASVAAAGFRRAVLRVDADNPTGAVRVYERLGFTVQESSTTHAGPLPP